MSDRPILFSAPMVRALLAGTKTQTRRALKPQPDDLYEGQIPKQLRVAIGDRLWVREAAAVTYQAWHHIDGHVHGVDYAADYIGSQYVHPSPGSSPRNGEAPSVFPDKSYNIDGSMRWSPSIHMPRWASRITLTVTDVRVQRLQDISEADAIAEGVKSDVWGSVVPFLADPEAADAHQLDRPVYWAPGDDNEDMVCLSARDAYARIWENIHGVGMWGLNEWVAAYTFTVEPRNIDALAREAA